MGDEMAELEELFASYCKFGDKKNSGKEMDNKKFAKCCKDSKLINKKVTSTDADIIFSGTKEKGKRVIGFDQFKDAITKMGKKHQPRETDDAKNLSFAAGLLVAAGAPSVNGVTKTDSVALHDDKSNYTGVYAKGGPSNVDKDNLDLKDQLDRTEADARGVKKDKAFASNQNNANKTFAGGLRAD